MSRIYATREDDGRRVLVALSCDGCGAETRLPAPGWTKRGSDRGPETEKFEAELCPACSADR